MREDARVSISPAVSPRPRVAVVGGGPGGYEAALVAAQLGADVTVVDSDGLGGAAVLTDVVPSKTLIATAEVMTLVDSSADLGVRFPGISGEIAAGPAVARGPVAVDLGVVNRRVKALALAQSADIRRRLENEGVRIVEGRGRLDGAHGVVAADGTGAEHRFEADTVLIAVGASPRELPDARPDGERILTWKQLYDLDRLPDRLVVVGSGVTGAEFASAYDALGADVVLISSRDLVLPGEDPDAAAVLEAVFRRRGVEVLHRSRAQQVKRTGDGVVVQLADGRTIEGSHCLMAVGAIPGTAGLGLAGAGVALTPGGHVQVDRVSRTTARGVYAAGDCTGVLALASVAAMQGRIAMWHALGDAVTPLNLRSVSANVFTAPEIATVGWSQAQIEAGQVRARSVKLPLVTNARAKMQGIQDGFVKLFCGVRSQEVLGGVVVAPRASELIFPVTLAVEHKLTVDDVAQAFTVYPSLSGSLAEAARKLHRAPPPP
jgi:dihydrolipoamide dehydrogenase